MKNQIFDWSRFVATLRKEVVENWRMMLFSILGIYGILALLMIIGNLIFGADRTMPAYIMRYTIVYMVFTYAGVIFASLAFSGIKDKAKRVEYLSLPSSTFEKFMANFLIYVIGFIVVFPICAQLADLTRIAILWPWSGGADVEGPINFLPTIHEFAANFDYPGGGKWLEAALWIAVIATPALYFLGSVVWPKLSFLKTFAAVYILEIVMIVVPMVIILIFWNMKDMALWFSQHVQPGSLMTAITCLSVVQLVVCLALSWWLWKRKDVVSLKWWL